MKIIKEKFNSLWLIFSSIGIVFASIMIAVLLDEGNLLSNSTKLCYWISSGCAIASGIIGLIFAMKKNLTKQNLAISNFFAIASCCICSLADIFASDVQRWTILFQFAVVIILLISYALYLINSKYKLLVVVFTLSTMLLFLKSVILFVPISISIIFLLINLLFSLFKKEGVSNE